MTRATLIADRGDGRVKVLGYERSRTVELGVHGTRWEAQLAAYAWRMAPPNPTGGTDNGGGAVTVREWGLARRLAASHNNGLTGVTHPL